MGFVDRYRTAAGAEVGSSAAMGREFLDRIETAHRSFLTRTYEKLMRAAALAERLAQSSGDASAIAELRDIAHSVVGTAGSFGYSRLSTLAEGLENHLRSSRPEPDAIVGLIFTMSKEFVAARRTN